MGQKSGLEELCDNLGVCFACYGSNGRFGAVEAGDVTKVSLDVWLQHNGQYGREGGSRNSRTIVLVRVMGTGP